MTSMADRGMKPARTLGSRYPHGARMRYVGGCRCSECRKANSRYENERSRARKNGDWNGLVSASRARAHIKKMRNLGVGRRAIHIATDVSDTVLQDIGTGRKKLIRARTERKILAVTIDAACDGAYIDARRTWQQVNQLLREGFTKKRISAEIGQGGRALQLGKNRVTVRNAAAVDRLWRQYMTPAGV